MHAALGRNDDDLEKVQQTAASETIVEAVLEAGKNKLS